MPHTVIHKAHPQAGQHLGLWQQTYQLWSNLTFYQCHGCGVVGLAYILYMLLMHTMPEAQNYMAHQPSTTLVITLDSLVGHPDSK